MAHVGSPLSEPMHTQTKMADDAKSAAMDDERRPMASDDSPLYGQKKVADRTLPAAKELTDGGVPPDE